MKINIITHDNGYGLTKDRQIIENSFKADYNFINTHNIDNSKLLKADLNIYLEVLDCNDGMYKEYSKLAKKQIIFPNPEWFTIRWLHHIQKFQLVVGSLPHPIVLFDFL